MTLEEVAQVGTAVGALASGISVFAGFTLYRLSKRDSHTSNTKQLILRSRETCRQLNRMIYYELAYEIVEEVILSRDMQFRLRRLFDDFFGAKEKSKEELETFLKDSFPPITVSIHTPLLDRIDDLLKAAQSDLGFIQNEYPGMFRVLHPILSVLRIVVNNHKSLVRDEKLWTQLLPEIYEKETFSCHDEFVRFLCRLFVAALLKRLKDHDQEDIDDLLQALDMAVDAYLSLKGPALYRIGQKERRISYRSLSETENISDDLREAEKALKMVLPQDKLLKYRELVVRFEQRNS